MCTCSGLMSLVGLPTILVRNTAVNGAVVPLSAAYRGGALETDVFHVILTWASQAVGRDPFVMMSLAETFPPRGSLARVAASFRIRATESKEQAAPDLSAMANFMPVLPTRVLEKIHCDNALRGNCRNSLRPMQKWRRLYDPK